MKSLVPSEWSVPARFRARLGEQAGRQRHMFEEGHLLLVLHELPRPGVAERKGRLFWRSPSGEWRSSGLGSGAQALKAHLLEYEQAIDGQEEKLAAASKAQDYLEVLQGTGPLLRAIRNLHRALQEAREAVPEDRDILTQRDRAGDLERACELLYADARNGLDFTVAQRAEEQAEAARRITHESHQLNLIAALFLPLTAIGSVFGMNLLNGFESWRAPWPFFGVLAAGMAIGFGLRSAIRKRKA